MRIALFHNLPLGGALRVVEEQVKHLKHEIKIFTTNPSLGRNRLKRDFNNFFYLNHLHKELAEKIEKENFNIVLVHHDKNTQAPFLLRHLRTPSVYFCEEWLRIVYEKELAFKKKVKLHKLIYEKISRSFRKKIDYINTNSASEIIANSSFTSSNIYKAYKKNSIVINPSVDSKKFKKTIRKRANQVLFVGSKDKINGYHLAQKAASLARVELKVIGGERLTDKELVNEYSKSIASINTSVNEPFGLVAIESMACETPALAVNEGGYVDSVVSGKTGFLLKRDAEEFAKKITLLKNKGLANKMGKLGRKHVIANFSWEKHVNLLEEVLKRNAI